jgi:DNA-binding transcriptional ArsR family regulator
VRVLVRAGDRGMSVGDVQRAVGVPASTLSHHLQRLRVVGLVSRTRDGTTLWCRANLARLRATTDFLVEECCADLAVPADDDAP